MNNHSGTTFLGKILIFILGAHLLLAEIATLELEVLTY